MIAQDLLPPPFVLTCVGSRGLSLRELEQLPLASRCLEASIVRAQLRVGRGTTAESFWERVLPDEALRARLLSPLEAAEAAAEEDQDQDRHCFFEVALGDEGLCLHDLGSAGTLVLNGRAVQDAPVPLRTGDVIGLRPALVATTSGAGEPSDEAPLLEFRVSGEAGGGHGFEAHTVETTAIVPARSSHREVAMTKEAGTSGVLASRAAPSPLVRLLLDALSC